ncbi:Phenylcoumaran benzylic ether reductase Pyrc5 [Pseudocercospora fuligena]|uniref:Phenylcoumaran benzylic ether reductase Pyrc5 n=1 Tax=Pseudocercospora fuligena TaxID=685502 RepID=A0A8H6RC36_9PEZI|nr:Phenylcoumaran benzylic ether reductase Pyrc5 [Pseudocercospora fuligena]
MASFKKITVYGAGGDNIGRYILDALLADPSYEVAVLSRKSSKSKYPSAVNDLRVSDNLPHDELVNALRGQDVVISAVGFDNGALETQFGVIDAAIEAGVKRFLPSEYGFDNAGPKASWLSPVFKIKNDVAQYLDKKAAENANFSWTAVATSIWLEWALPLNFLGMSCIAILFSKITETNMTTDIDPKAHTVAYWDNGTHKPAHTTLSYAAQGVLECLKHPKETKNKRIFMQAFAASQREIVAELEKQQGVKYTELSPIDGTIAVQNAHQSWEASLHKDQIARIQTVKAQILVKEYGTDFVEAGKKPLLETFVDMPKVTLQDVVKTVVGKVK